MPRNGGSRERLSASSGMGYVLPVPSWNLHNFTSGWGAT